MTNSSEIAATAVTERIGHEESDRDSWICICGNTPESAGFDPCDGKGDEMEPTIDSTWDGKYMCAECGRIIDMDTLEVLGRNESPCFPF